MHVEVTTQRVGEAVVVHATGEVDLHTASGLQTPLDEAVADRAPRIVADLSGVDFMDSTGLSVIVATIAAAREYGGEVRVVTGSQKIAKLFTLTGVDKQVGLYASVAEAVS